MSPADPPRVAHSADLGRVGRRVDVALGVAAILPILGLAVLAPLAGGDAREAVRTLAVIWSGGLLCFFSGVRRGLSFSEARGARPAEVATLLVLFATGVLTLLLRSAGLAAAGFLLVALFDGLAARRREAPDYFALLRPLQMTAGALGLALIAWVSA